MFDWGKPLQFLLLMLLVWPAAAQDGSVVRTVDTPQGLRKIWLPVGQAALPSRPALVVLHGAASSPAQIERLSGFSQLAQRENLAVFYPEAVDGRWNDGRRDAFPPPGPQNDVAFLAACLDFIVAEYKVDPKKLFLVGFDAGGSLALVAGLQLPGRLAGLAVCCAGLPSSVEVRPSATPLLVIASQADPCVPFAGGDVRYFGGRSRGQVVACDQLMRSWTGVTGPGTSEALAWGAREYWGSSAQRLRLLNAGHLWPGTEAPVSEQLFGPLCRELSASAAIWDFFRSLP